MTGKTFGRWTVLDSFITTDSGEKKWLCRCECGTEKYVLERNLKYGGSLSCGCGKTINRTSDLKGKVFGKLTVTGKSEVQKKNGGIWWHCVCECGTEKDYPATLLNTGKRTSCGCDKEKAAHNKDISGQIFGSITALHPTDKRDKKSNVIWHCVCNECGKEIDISYNELLYGNRKSCGCIREKHREKLQTFITRVEGTSIDRIKSDKTQKNNTTGHRGVYFIKGKYTAKIVFQKKPYYLGRYDRIEDAITARQAAEDLLMKGTVDHYEKWKQLAQENPQWAQENPFSIRVYRTGDSEIMAEFLPEI